MGQESKVSRDEYLKRVRSGYPAKITNTRRCWTQADYNDMFELLKLKSESKNATYVTREASEELEISEDELLARISKAAEVGFEYMAWTEEEDKFLKHSYCQHTYLDASLRKHPMGWMIDTSVAFPHRSKEAAKRRQKVIMAKPKQKKQDKEQDKRAEEEEQANDSSNSYSNGGQKSRKQLQTDSMTY